MKMAVVGCEASGKTVFMCALADHYGQDAATNPLRLRLTPENAAANAFERYQFRQMRQMRQWPPATRPDHTVELKWALRREGEALAEIDLLEFGGETFRAAFRDGDGARGDASVKELLDYLSDTDFFVVLVSIKALLEDGREMNSADYDRETEALWVTRGLLDFIRTKRPNAGVVIGLTQADKYRNEIGAAGGPRQLFAAHWPTVAASNNALVVDVASVSQVDEQGNPANGYNTHGILPVMQAFSKHCFGDENALENGAQRMLMRTALKRHLTVAVLAGITLGAVACGLWRVFAPSHNEEPVVIHSAVTNTVEKLKLVEKVKLVERPVTNTVETVKFVEKVKVVDRPVTNTIERVKVVEKMVDRPVTNTIEKVKVVEKLVDRPVTNTIEKVKVVEKMVDRPVTNTVEKVKVVEKIVLQTVTNVIERVVEKAVAPRDLLPSTLPGTVSVATNAAPTSPEAEALKKLPPGFRVWTDYNGRKIIAKWVDVAVDESGITILTRYNRRIDAVLWKFAPEDQEYIKAEIKKHKAKNELMSEGKWIRNPLLRE